MCLRKASRPASEKTLREPRAGVQAGELEDPHKAGDAIRSRRRVMTLAPSWLPRQQRRHVDRALHKLLRRGVCSICGGTLRHNSPTASGFDAHGTVAVAGECCFDRLTQVFGFGLYSDRHYDFLMPCGSAVPSEAPPEKIVEALTAY